MSVSYTCPNPDCGVTLKTPSRVQAGKSVKCPKCARMFVPEPAEEADGEAAPKLAAELKKAGKSEPARPAPAPAANKPIDDDDEDAASVKKGYGVVGETEEEKKQAQKNKPKFTAVKDRFKKSARGPAISLLVMPSNLLTLAGLLTVVVGLGTFVVGMWPLVFNDAPPGEEEMEDAVVTMMLGMVILFWGAMVCYCSSQMQELASYPWAMVGAIMGIVPLLVGIYAIVMLQNPKVKAGFEESEGGPEEEEEEEDDEDDDDEEEEEEDDDDDGGGGTSGKGGTGKKLAKKLGRGLLNKALGGDDEEEEE
jgi:hypothetical protein